jgi:hypothetical protein
MYPLGLNIAPANYWSPCPFLDQMKVASITPSPGKLTLGVPLDTEIHNWTLIASPDVTQVRLPTMGISIKGSGTFTFDAAGTPGHGTQIALSTATPEQTTVQLVRTDWLDEINGGETFTPDFLDKVTGAPVLRFMDWCDTNGSTATAWTPADAVGFSGEIVPIELIAALCNQAGADAWINIPASIPTAEAVRVVALCRALLFPWLKLHVEWSNEVWNTAFPIGKVAKASPVGPHVYYGQKCAELAKAIAGIDGVDMILCWQWLSPGRMPKVVEAFKAAGGDMDKVFAFGFAPYPYNEAPIASFMPDNYDGLLDELERNRLAKAPNFAAWVAMGKTYGKPVVRYEEALSPFARGADQVAFCVAAQKLPKAGRIMRALWADADAAGCGFGCFYTSAAQGVFGFAPDYASDGYPQRAAWAGYNKRAWPMSRAMGRSNV